MDIVVAKYNEDLAWLDNINAEKIVYSKGSGGNLKNIGREAHTYAYHIAKNYESISEWTTFVQGNPLDHCPDLIETINSFYTSKEFRSGKKFLYLGNWIATCDIDGKPHHPNLDIGKFQELLFGGIVKNRMTFIAGAQFIVHKDLIQNKSKAFWDKLLDIFEQELHSQDAWCAERLWPYIFETHSDV